MASSQLIIAPKSAHKFLLQKYRANNYFCPIKIMDKNELINLFFAKFNKSALYYLMDRYDITYDIAKEMLNIFPFLSTQKTFDNPKIKDIQNKNIEVENHFKLLNNEYASQIFKGKEIIIYAYSKDDTLLNKIFFLSNIETKDLKYIDIRIEKEDLYLYEFENIESETLYVLNEIAKLVDENNINRISPEHIYVYLSNDEYRYQIEKYQDKFNLKFNKISSNSLLNVPLIQSFLKKLDENNDIELSFQTVDNLKNTDNGETYFILKDIVDEIKKLQIKNDIKIIAIKKEIENTNIYSPPFDNGINLINDITLDEEGYVFILGAALNHFPSSIKNNSFLLEEEKKEIGLVLTNELNYLSLFSALNVLFSKSKYTFMSYALKSASSNFSPTTICSDFKINIKKPDIVKEYYSPFYALIRLAMDDDLAKFYSFESPTRKYLLNCKNIHKLDTYDNQFKKFDIYKKDDGLLLSYSATKDYLSCQFKYYLSRVLKIEDNSDTFNMELGTLAHFILEHMHDKDFDFDKLFDEQFNQNTSWDMEKRIVVKGLTKKYLLNAVDAIKIHESYMTNPSVFLEEKPNYYHLVDNIYLTGRIDKSIVIDNDYLVLIDYKTGSTKVEFSKIETGESLQLPTYGLLAQKDKNLFKYSSRIGGMYLQGVIPKDILLTKDEDDLIYDNFKLIGKSINDTDELFKFDSTCSAGSTSSFIQGVKITKSGDFSKGKSKEPIYYSFDEFNNIVERAKNIYITSGESILNNDFYINPKRDKNSNSCEYCPYRDICYVKNNQFIFLGQDEDGK